VIRVAVAVHHHGVAVVIHHHGIVVVVDVVHWVIVGAFGAIRIRITVVIIRITRRR
jgi:hypothetical protein